MGLYEGLIILGAYIRYDVRVKILIGLYTGVVYFGEGLIVRVLRYLSSSYLLKHNSSFAVEDFKNRILPIRRKYIIPPRSVP